MESQLVNHSRLGKQCRSFLSSHMDSIIASDWHPTRSLSVPVSVLDSSVFYSCPSRDVARHTPVSICLNNIPVSVEPLTHLTLSNGLTGHHLFILQPARFRLPTLLMEHIIIIIIIISMDAISILQRRTCKLPPYIRSKLRKESNCRLPRLCIDPSAIIRQSPYATASGNLGDVYRCMWNSDEVSHRFMFSPCTHSGFRSRSNPFDF
jgi:hypothetical protein